MITAIVLAGGESRRMGRPKMVMAWGSATVLAQVIRVLREGGAEDILVVTGGARQEVEEICSRERVTTVHNEEYASNEMLGSLQTGLRSLSADSEAALVTLGDQPQTEAATIHRLLEQYEKDRPELLVPSYQLHRGHPWVLGSRHWAEVLAMSAPDSLREFLNRHTDDIRYVEVDSPTILQDLDTPEDYARRRPAR